MKRDMKWAGGLALITSLVGTAGAQEQARNRGADGGEWSDDWGDDWNAAPGAAAPTRDPRQRLADVALHEGGRLISQLLAEWLKESASTGADRIVAERQREKYPQAIRDLRAAAASGGSSGARAQAQLDALELDLLLHLAQRASEAGDRARAEQLKAAALQHPRLSHEARRALGALPTHPSDLASGLPARADQEQVTTPAGRRVRRGSAVAFEDPTSGKPFFVALDDPALLRRQGGDSALDVVSRGLALGPQAPLPQQLPPAAATRGLAGALGALGD